jgi:hypothetical protein
MRATAPGMAGNANPRHQERHADLAARSAIAYATFVLDTVNDPGAPWHG